MGALPFPCWLRPIVGTHHFIYFFNTWFKQKPMCIPDPKSRNLVAVFPTWYVYLENHIRHSWCPAFKLCPLFNIYVPNSTFVFFTNNLPSFMVHEINVLNTYICVPWPSSHFPCMNTPKVWGRSHRSNFFFSLTTLSKLEELVLDLLKYSLWFLEITALEILSNTDFWEGG